MRAWGTGPLKNDAAQDLILALEPLSVGGRVFAVREVFAEHGAWDRRRREATPGIAMPDGVEHSQASLRAIAAAWLVAAALERVVRPRQPAMLAGAPANVLGELANTARDTLALILTEEEQVADLSHDADARSGEIRRLHAALAADAPTVPAGTGEYEDLDDPGTLARHNRLYRTKMLLLMATLIVAVYVFR